jgi:hypothetical protein
VALGDAMNLFHVGIVPQLTFEDDNRWHDYQPKHGWDNYWDERYATRLIQDNAGCCTSKKDLPWLQSEIIWVIRDHAVSAKTCAQLLLTFGDLPYPPEIIEDAVYEAYYCAYTPPGLRSFMNAPEDRTWPSEPGETPYSPPEKPWPINLNYNPDRSNDKLAADFLHARIDRVDGGRLIYADGEFFTLNRLNIWRQISEDELLAELRKTDPALTLTTPRLEGMLKALRALCHVTAKPFDWIEKPNNAPDAKDMILFRNGALNVTTGELAPLTGQYFTTGAADFNYDAAAWCQTWIEKLREWLDPSFHSTLQEFMGYLLTGDNSIETMLVMLGASRGGKGTIAHVMQSLVGPNHHVSRTMNDLAGDFGLWGATDKRLLIIPDAHNAETTKRAAVLERLKSITGNDVISVNRKNLGIINVKIPARVVLVCNQLPKFLDESGALAARQLPLVFTNSFVGKEDRELRNKLTAELPGICNWALAGLRRLRENGNRFTVGDKGKRMALDMKMGQSPALRFARDHLNVTGDASDFAPLDLAFERYLLWTTEEGLSARERRNRDDFKTDLAAALMSKGVRYDRRRWKEPGASYSVKAAPRMRGFVGVKLKPLEGVP